MHYAETEIVPIGVKAGYPTSIDFTILSDWINDIKNDLLNIIECKLESWFRDLALSVYNEPGLTRRDEELKVKLEL